MKPIVHSALAFFSILALLLVPNSLNANGADHLKTSLAVSPAHVELNRMPGPHPPRTYKMKFTFVVSNSDKSEYEGSAPSCKTFDIEVVSLAVPDHSVWKSSEGQMYCQMITPVHIAAGKSWRKVVRWTFTTDKIQDGKYRATATFIPTDKSESVDFEIASVQ